MTKLEAWKEWCEEAHVTDATEYTLEKSSHGKAFSAGWDAAFDKYAKIFDSYTKTTARSRVERIVMWMNANNYATGHGSAVEDLLKELEWQIAEREREACAKVCEKLPETFKVAADEFGYKAETPTAENYAAAIRTRIDK